MAAIELEVLNREVRQWLADSTEKQVGLARTPSHEELMPYEDLQIPYLVLYPLSTAKPTGSFGDFEEDTSYPYQVTVVGVDPRQVLHAATIVERAWKGKDANGGYLFPMTLTATNLQWREGDSLSGVVPAGVNLYNMFLNYRIQVGA